MDIEHLRQWIGREERAGDTASPAPLAGLAALLDYETSPWTEGEVPPLGHWLYFLPRARQLAIDVDGHPKRGDFLPPVPLPRRMWAAGEVVFHAPLAVGAPIERVSTIADVTAKAGSSGPLVFVTLRHAISCNGMLAIEERQDLVYRGPGEAPAPVTEAPIADAIRIVTPDPVALFRYSALTFNGHRIHYDRAYAQTAEGYPGLVVHGPYAATLLVDHFLRETPGAVVKRFSFRARRPLFDTAPFSLNLRRTGGATDVWTADVFGQPAMTGMIEDRGE